MKVTVKCSCCGCVLVEESSYTIALKLNNIGFNPPKHFCKQKGIVCISCADEIAKKMMAMLSASMLEPG